MTKLHIQLLCGLGLLFGILGLWLGFAKIILPGGAPELLIASAIVTAGSLIAAAVVYGTDMKNK